MTKTHTVIYVESACVAQTTWGPGCDIRYYKHFFDKREKVVYLMGSFRYSPLYYGLLVKWLKYTMPSLQYKRTSCTL